MVGGGFYALVGKVAGLAGPYAPISFLLSAIVAAFSALTFCELAARYPYSGGPARYVEEVFGAPWLARAVGWTVIATGVISAATLADAVAGFLTAIVPIPTQLGVLGTVALLTAVAVWGIGKSVKLAVTITLIEVGGLLFVVFVSSDAMAQFPTEWPGTLPPPTWEPLSALLLASFLAFYSFIGFEDLVTLAEEAKKPARSIPRAILLSLGITTLLYLLVVVAAMGSVPGDVLAQSDNPLVDVVRSRGIQRAEPMAAVAVLSGVNGALVQIVMGARVLYGLADRHTAPRMLARVHPTTQTPIAATLSVGIVTLALAWLLPLLTLARATSLLLLLVFSVVNVALVALKIREPTPATTGPCYPIWIPAMGAASSVAFILVELVRLVA